MPKKKTDKEKGKEPEKTEPEKTEPETKKEKSTKELVNEACKDLDISKDDITKVDRYGDEIVIELKAPESKKIRYPS